MPDRIRRTVEQRAQSRCEYCQAPQRVAGYRFHIEHIVPRVASGTDDLSNLALACASCNLAKGARTQATDSVTKTRVPLFNPRLQRWPEHFQWADDGITVVGLTPTGRATVDALDLNAPLRLVARRDWREIDLLP